MDCNTNNCPAYIKAEQNEKDIKEIKDMNLASTIATMQTQLTQIITAVNKLVEKPAQRWEMVIGALIVAGVTIVAEIVFK